MLSPVRPSSVFCLSVTFLHPTEPVEIFGNSFIHSFIIDQIKSDTFTVYRFRGTEQIKTTSKNYDEINASSKVVGKLRATAQMILSVEGRSRRVQRRQGTPYRRVSNSGWEVRSLVMFVPNVDVVVL